MQTFLDPTIMRGRGRFDYFGSMDGNPEADIRLLLKEHRARREFSESRNSPFQRQSKIHSKSFP